MTNDAGGKHPGGKRRRDEAEFSVLGACFISPDAADLAKEILTANDFAHEAHAAIFRAILRLRADSHDADAISTCAELERCGDLKRAGGEGYIAKIVDRVPTAANVRYHAATVLEFSNRRRIHAAADEDDPIAAVTAVESAIREAAERRAGAAIGLTGLELARRVSHLLKHPPGPGIPYPLTDMNRLLGGLKERELTLLAGRPSMGKTALGLQTAAVAACRDKLPVLFVSLEMSADELTLRILQSRTGISVDVFRDRYYERTTPKQQAHVFDLLDRISSAPLTVLEQSGLIIPDLLTIARQHRRRFETRLIIVDHLQLLSASADNWSNNRVQEVSVICRALKSMAVELEVPVLVMSHLSRSCENRTNKRPRLADLRDSGELEQSADNVVSLYRDEYYHPNTGQRGEVEIIVGKQRNGPTGTVRAQWAAERATFRDLTKREDRL